MNIGIAGAGIMGRVLAWQLLQDGHQLTLFDIDPIDSGEAAAYTAAGMLAPYSELESTELLIYHMGIESLQLWPDMATSLDADIGFYQSGCLVVSHHQDKADHHRFNQRLLGKIKPSPDKWQLLDRQQIHSLEPGLVEDFTEATYLPKEAWLDPQRVMPALANYLIEKNVTWHSEVEVRECAQHCISSDNQLYEFDWVIDCRGLGAKSEWQGLRGVRGELLWLEAPEVEIKHLIRLMHPRYNLYVVPKMYDNLFVIGATQIESDDRGAITVRSVLELLSAAYSLHPGFAEARVVDMKTNCRPALSDNLPRIKTDEGLIQVNGLYRHGFLLAPILAREVAQWLSEEGSYHSSFGELFQQAA